jgi:hypothetical protein
MKRQKIRMDLSVYRAPCMPSRTRATARRRTSRVMGGGEEAEEKGEGGQRIGVE